MKILAFYLLVLSNFGANIGQRNQYGPDPWDVSTSREKDTFISPDSRVSSSSQRSGNDTAASTDYFFRRLLTIVLKTGAVQTTEDGFKEISLAMKLPAERWKVLEEIMKSEKPLTEEMYRRSVGYVADAVFKPSFTERVVQAWSEYVVGCYQSYQEEVTWMFIIITIIITMVISSKYTSLSKLLWIALFVMLYLYEGLLSYKEYEKQNYEQFVAALNACSWKFWSSTCDVPMSDSLSLWKHMHPSKIVVRMVSHFVTEPLLLLSTSVNEISNQITCNLYPPFNSIAHAMLILLFNITFITLFIMLVFTYILNLRFNTSLLGGLVHFGVNRQETRASKTRKTSNGGDRISGENLYKLINILSHSQVTLKENVNTVDGKRIHSAREARSTHRAPALQYRSHSTGRLADRFQRSIAG